MPDHNVPGFLAVAHDVGAPEGPDLQKALALVGVADATLVQLPHVELATWGLGAGRPTPDVPLLLSGTNWSEGGSVPAARLGQWLSADSPEPPRPMLPPFAALGAAGDGLVLASDTMGFRQLFDRRGPGWQALSTSARALAALGDGRLDREALLLQSLLGWQLGQRTLFDGRHQARPGRVRAPHGRDGGQGGGGGRGSRAGLAGRGDEPGRRACSVRSSSATWTRTPTRPSSSPEGRTPAWC